MLRSRAYKSSPDQSSFLDVTHAYAPATETKPARAAIADFYVEERTVRDFYDSCAGVTFGQMNFKTLTLISGGHMVGHTCAFLLRLTNAER